MRNGCINLFYKKVIGDYAVIFANILLITVDRPFTCENMLLCKVQHFCSIRPSGYESDGDTSYFTYREYRLRQTRTQFVIEQVDHQTNSESLSLQVCERDHNDQRYLSDDQALSAMSKCPKIEHVFSGNSLDTVAFLSQHALYADTPVDRAARGILRTHLTKYLRSPFTYESREIQIPRIQPRVSSFYSRGCNCNSWYW